MRGARCLLQLPVRQHLRAWWEMCLITLIINLLCLRSFQLRPQPFIHPLPRCSRVRQDPRIARVGHQLSTLDFRFVHLLLNLVRQNLTTIGPPSRPSCSELSLQRPMAPPQHLVHHKRHKQSQRRLLPEPQPQVPSPLVQLHAHALADRDSTRRGSLALHT